MINRSNIAVDTELQHYPDGWPKALMCSIQQYSLQSFLLSLSLLLVSLFVLLHFFAQWNYAVDHHTRPRSSMLQQLLLGMLEMVGLVLLKVFIECKWGPADTLCLYRSTNPTRLSPLLSSLFQGPGGTTHLAPLFKSQKQCALTSQLSHAHWQDCGFIRLQVCSLVVRDRKWCRPWIHSLCSMQDNKLGFTMSKGLKAKQDITYFHRVNTSHQAEGL